jgi:hypothetical protein
LSEDCAACVNIGNQDDFSAAAVAPRTSVQHTQAIQNPLHSSSSSAATLISKAVSNGHVIILSDDDDNKCGCDVDVGVADADGADVQMHEDDVVDDSECDDDDDDDDDDDVGDDDDDGDDDDGGFGVCNDGNDGEVGDRNALKFDNQEYLPDDHDDAYDASIEGGGCERDHNISLDALLLQYRIQQQHHFSVTDSEHKIHRQHQQQPGIGSSQSSPHRGGCIIV